MFKSCGLTAVVLSFAIPFSSAQQIQPGAGNAKAIALAQKSPEVQSAYAFVIEQAHRLKDRHLRDESLDALANPRTCITHRSGVDTAKKNALLQQLLNAGLINPADGATFPGGLLAGVFPPVLDEGSNCPHLPPAFFSAPGSVPLLLAPVEPVPALFLCVLCGPLRPLRFKVLICFGKNQKS